MDTINAGMFDFPCIQKSDFPTIYREYGKICNLQDLKEIRYIINSNHHHKGDLF